MTPWALLIAAGLFEIAGITGFQQLSQRRYARGLPLTVLGFGLALTMLHWATQDLPLTLAYAVFTAVGTLGSVLLGAMFWGERLPASRLFWVALVVASLIGLKLTYH